MKLKSTFLYVKQSAPAWEWWEWCHFQAKYFLPASRQKINRYIRTSEKRATTISAHIIHFFNNNSLQRRSKQGLVYHHYLSPIKSSAKYNSSKLLFFQERTKKWFDMWLLRTFYLYTSCILLSRNIIRI